MGRRRERRRREEGGEEQEKILGRSLGNIEKPGTGNGE